VPERVLTDNSLVADERSVLDEEPGSDAIGDRDLTNWRTPAGRSAVRAARRLRLSPAQVLWISLLAGMVVLVAATALAGAIYDAVTESDGVSLLDRPALDLAISIRSPALTRVAETLAFVGGQLGMTVLATVVTLFVAWRFRSWTSIVLMAVTAAGSLAMTLAGKAVVGRTRPPVLDALPPFETSPSFPSGHSLNAVAIAGVVAYVLLRRQHRTWQRVLTGVGAVVFSVLMGLSRVYLGQHWLTDVLVAWALGVAWLAVVVMAHRIFLTLRRGREPRAARPSTGSGRGHAT
jgi:membrane-associated phospholipid phosphatase